MLKLFQSILLLFVLIEPLPAVADPLPSWNKTEARERLHEFIADITNEESVGFVPPDQRIAVFDGDGTLWTEKPTYFEFYFSVHRAHELAIADPGFASTPALKAAATGGIEAVLSLPGNAMDEVIEATHSGTTVDKFKEAVRSWRSTAHHPETGRLFYRMIFQPMVELISHLSNNGFQVFIVSGSGQDFLRAFAADLFGLPPGHVIGSSRNYRYESGSVLPQLFKEHGYLFFTNKANKPIAIELHIGVKPVMATGNSDGDIEMLEWTTDAGRARLGILIHHTDAKREYAYDRNSKVGRLDQGLILAGQAQHSNWLVVDMARDWRHIWP